jgi:hypothetical protein
MTSTRTVLVVLAIGFVAAPAAAHVPGFAGDNTSPGQAYVVEDATKSWSFYDSLAPGQVRYYAVSLSAGERLRVGTFTPGESAVTPSLVLMSTAIDGTEAVPPGVTVPAGLGARVVAGERPDAPAYEPFTPAVTYPTASVEERVDSDRRYLLAVYEPANRSGPVGVTVGYRESFSPVEYATVPFALVQTRLWAGQHPLLVAGPLLAALLGGAVLVRRRQSGAWRRPAVRSGLAGAALLVLGSAFATVVQMALALTKTGPTAAALVTAVYAAVPAVCGGWVLAVVLRDALVPTRRTRLALAGAGIACLLTWAGFLVAPVAFLAVALAPARLLGEGE